MTEGTERIIAEFRVGGGRVGGAFEHTDLALLTTFGDQSGERRTAPVRYARDGERILVYAAEGAVSGEGEAGSDGEGDGESHPGWYRDLVVHQRVEVEIGDGEGGVRTLAARAEPLAAGPPEPALPLAVLHPLDLSAPDAERNRAIARQLLTVHAALRRQIAALRDGGAEDAELAVHCLAFCESLGGHHATEETVLPAFDTAFPHLAPVLARLRAEHRDVALALEELRTLLAAQDGTDPAVLQRRIAALAAEAEAHFAYEEVYLLPALAGTGTKAGTGAGTGSVTA